MRITPRLESQPGGHPSGGDKQQGDGTSGGSGGGTSQQPQGMVRGITFFAHSSGSAPKLIL